MVDIHNKENWDTLLEYIRTKLTPNLKAKKNRGEVFTRIQLVHDMLDQLPKKVWSNPKLKWLEPANGIGNFPIIVYMRLMKGLIKKIKNETKRSHHIITNMLYMVEINKENVSISKKIFGEDANIYTSDFLTFTFHTKFDIIMGNPPYQIKVGEKKTLHIWDKFVIKSIQEHLQPKGYLLFVHPGGWRNIKGEFRKVFDIIQERDLQTITMRDFNDGAKMFGSFGTNYDYYCLKNTITHKNKTKINDVNKQSITIDVNKYSFIPNGKFKLYEKLVNGDDKVDVMYSSYTYESRPHNSKLPTKKIKDEHFKYPIVYTITQKKGMKCTYANQKSYMFVPKVIWSNGVGTYPIIDREGMYGLTQFSYAIVDKVEHLEFIKNAMNDPEFIDLMKCAKFTTNHKYNYKIIKTFKKDFWKEFKYKHQH